MFMRMHELEDLADARREGHAEGLEEGHAKGRVRGSAETMREYGWDDESIITKLMQKYSLTREEARKYLEM